MKLTRRQETFVKKLLDLYKEVESPIHYSELADRLGVNRFTAYDMLRLLEEKGLVASQYVLDDQKSGPGRSSIVFMPTKRARQLLLDLSGDAGGEDWEAAKERILETIQAAESLSGVDRKLSEDVFARMPPENSTKSAALSYCIEVMTIIALRLTKTGRQQLMKEYLPEILPSENQTNLASLSLLGGFVLGFLASENMDGGWNYELFKHVKHYVQLVAEMTSQERGDLVAGLEEVFKPLIDSS
jgi:DNA-binding MarR family transcriptional regulator